MIDHRIYLVTDDPSRYRTNWLDNVVAAVEGGVTCVQYRDTENDARAQYSRIRDLQDALRRFKTPLIVNNNPDLAAAVEADGLHVGQGDISVRDARLRVGDRCEIGLSITSPDQVAKIGTGDARPDLLGIGPIFDATKTKADAAAALGPAGLARIVRATEDFPNVAIGGLTLANLGEVRAAGAQGVALVSAFSRTENPFAVARAIRTRFFS